MFTVTDSQLHNENFTYTVLKCYYSGPKGLIPSSEICLSSNPLIDYEDPISGPTDGISNSLIGSLLVKSRNITFNVPFTVFYSSPYQAKGKITHRRIIKYNSGKFCIECILTYSEGLRDLCPSIATKNTRM